MTSPPSRVTHQKLGGALYEPAPDCTLSMMDSNTLRPQGSSSRNPCAAAGYSLTESLLCTRMNAAFCTPQRVRRPPVATWATTYANHGMSTSISIAPCALPRQSIASRYAAVSTVSVALMYPADPGCHVVKTMPMEASTQD